MRSEALAGPPAYVPKALLEGSLPAAPNPQLAELLEAQLVRLNACESRLDLRLASALAGIAMREVHLLGHGTREDFARERLGCSWSHVRELLIIEKGLRDLPRLREAFLLGALRRARLREILRVATPDTESAWLLLARSVTSAELAARVRAVGGKDASSKDPGPELHRVSIRVSPEEAVFIESIGLPMLRAVVGKEGPKHELMSALAAEILAEPGHEPLEAEVSGREGSCKSSRSRRVRRTLRAQAKAAARARRLLQRLTARAGGQPEPEPEISWPVASGTDLESRLAHAQVLIRWRRAVEAQRAILVDLFHERGWYRLRGHATFADWLDRRLGLAPREVVLLERVVRDVAALPEIDAAWRSGAMSSLQADKVARVASPETAGDWARFVEEATTKRLDVELAAHAALRVHLGDDGWLAATNGGRPLRERSMGDLRMRWADVFGGQVGEASEASETGETAEGSCEFGAKSRRGPPSRSAAGPAVGPPGGPPGSCNRRPATPGTFSFEASAEAVAEFRFAMNRVDAETGRAMGAAGCLIEMFWRFATTHVVPGLRSRTLREKILRRDGWTCAMPHCRNRRNLEVHHVIYRSRGGGNEKWNLVSACRSCHSLEHLGHIFVTCLGVVQSRGGIAPMLEVRVGDEALRSSTHVYREGLRYRRLEYSQRSPSMAAGW